MRLRAASGGPASPWAPVGGGAQLCEAGGPWGAQLCRLCGLRSKPGWQERQMCSSGGSLGSSLPRRGLLAWALWAQEVCRCL